LPERATLAGVKRASLSLLLGTVLSVALAGPALGARVVTWTTPSRFVDLSAYNLGGTPPHLRKPPALRVNVFLPDGYDGRRRFPVLYLLHGHGEGYADWADPKKGNVLETARGFPGIIVMAEGWRGWFANWWNGGRRANPAWERYHLDELIPFIERRLRVRPGRRWHAVAGWSMGGLGALFYASQRPGYFGSAASFSGTMSMLRPDWPTFLNTQGEGFERIFGDPQAQRFYLRGHSPTALTENLRHTRLYVTTGNGVPRTTGELTDIPAEAYVLQHNNDFFLAATLAGLDITYRPRNGVHNMSYWREHFAAARAWGYFNPVADSPREWTYQTVARTGEMWGLRFRFAAPPAVLETFRARSGTLSAEGQGTVTIETAAGCGFTARLPFSRALPSRCRLKLRVRPRRARVGRRTRFRFRAWIARDGIRVPVRQARIRFAGRTRRTGARGRASMVVRLRRPGVRRVRARAPGLPVATATVRIRR
jgi:S-formylglutathione hydrolase FrmB